MKKIKKVTYHYDDGSHETFNVYNNFKKVQFRLGITQKQVKELFDYDSTNGGLIWKKANKNLIGKKAGSQEKEHGYKRICISGQTYREHHVVWLWHYGKLPNCIIDHINQKRDDNRIENLRKSDPSSNNVNRGIMKNNTSGYTGVKFVGKKWCAEITRNKKTIRLGNFITKEEAIIARKTAEKKYDAIN